MKDTYSYLKDPRALAEIRKHKWLRSQEESREIGFASAAVDWIKKYGEEWKRVHVKSQEEGEYLVERRKYRRFQLKCMVELLKNNALQIAEAVDISFQGLLCRTTQNVRVGTQMCARLVCGQGAPSAVYQGSVERFSLINAGKYEFFIRFNDASQNELQHWDFFKRAR